MKSRKLAGLAAALLLLAGAARADVAISSKATSNMSCDAGVCTATAQKAVLNVTDLTSMLASGDVAVKTGSVAKDIDIDQPLTWASTSRLTLDAQRSVTVKKQVTVAAQGALTVATNDTGQPKNKSKTGEFIIVPEHGSVQFRDLGSSLIIDGNSYTLVGDIKTLAADIAANPSGFYALAKPYDASVDGTYTSSPIPTGFGGSFEGLGNAISKLSITADALNLYGLFAAVLDTGTVNDLGVTLANFQIGQHSGIGTLAANNLGIIRRCWATGTMEFGRGGSAGGLVAGGPGSIVSSFADVKLRGNPATDERTGGLAGDQEGTISLSYALGSIAFRNGAQPSVGGLIGENKGHIANSFARNSLKFGRGNQSPFLGGLVGQNDNGGTVEDSYAAGAITPGSNFGGLVGYDRAAPGAFQNTYWDLDAGIDDPHQGAGNVNDDPGITGLTTQQFQSELPLGFNPKIWAQNSKTNGGFPYLR